METVRRREEAAGRPPATVRRANTVGSGSLGRIVSAAAEVRSRLSLRRLASSGSEGPLVGGQEFALSPTGPHHAVDM
jgi:hypothetical protein